MKLKLLLEMLHIEIILALKIEEKVLGVKFHSNLSFEVMPPLFVKRQARNYALLQEYHITWT